ncbi:hypothetical protein [Aeromicrobium ginsengisoli]|uniref:Lipoprotein n=1 Tax=Aeromicrobium ginsengisoli TaxID=363867 RepID=A0A5M4FBA5_9ACTN|nr:hypothetical protein [Aeromicrobium ginsengisoli]KAA1395648.1 hypothetical protein ESP70_015985 [Aeromicrobium ginsengisoli]
MPRFARSRRVAAVAVVVVALAGLTACDPRSDPITPRGAGFQQTADHGLDIWFGGPCRDVVEVELGFVKDDDDKDALKQVLRAPGFTPSVELPAKAPAPGTGIPSLETLTLGTTPDGLRATSALPKGFDWRDYETVRLLVKTSGGQAATYLSTKRLTEESADHPGEFYVQDQGWFDKAAFAEADGDGFKALCSSINP